MFHFVVADNDSAPYPLHENVAVRAFQKVLELVRGAFCFEPARAGLPYRGEVVDEFLFRCVGLEGRNVAFGLVCLFSFQHEGIESAQSVFEAEANVVVTLGT